MSPCKSHKASFNVPWKNNTTMLNLTPWGNFCISNYSEVIFHLWCVRRASLQPETLMAEVGKRYTPSPSGCFKQNKNLARELVTWFYYIMCSLTFRYLNRLDSLYVFFCIAIRLETCCIFFKETRESEEDCGISQSAPSSGIQNYRQELRFPSQPPH